MEFKNSFYNVAVEAVKKNGKTASGQIELIDNFTSNAPLLASIPFQKASNNYHHVYSRLLDADNLQVVDFDGRLPTLRAQSQLEKVDLTPFGGSFEFGEDLMLQSHGNAKDYLADQIPPVLRKTGMELERSLYINNFLTKTIAYETVRSANAAASAGNHYPTMVAVTWEPGEMTGLYSPLPYGRGESFGKLFETEWTNNKARLRSARCDEPCYLSIRSQTICRNSHPCRKATGSKARSFRPAPTLPPPSSRKRFPPMSKGYSPTQFRTQSSSSRSY
jgi:hypothetical protein